MVAAVVTGSAVGATGTANAVTIDKPTGVADGDLLIAVTWCRYATADFTTVPTGWTAASGTQVASFGFLHLWYKQVSSAASEPASYSWSGATGGSRTVGLMARVTGHNTTTPIDVIGNQAGMIVAVPNDYAPAPSVTTTEANTLLLGVGAFRDGIQATAVTFIDNAGMTHQFTHAMPPTAAHDGVGLLAEARPTAGATGVKNLMVSVSDVTTGAGYILAIKSAAATGTDGSVTAVAATATALAEPPAVSTQTTISDGGPATATAEAVPPVVLGDTTPVSVEVVAVLATATATTPTPVASVAYGVLAPTALATASISTPGVLVIAPTFRFTPPTFEAPMQTMVRPFNYFRLTYAASIVRINGTLTEVLAPNTDLLTAAGVEGVDYFLGGRIYNVSAATKAELIAAGYTVE